jgi:Fe-S-cluster-containing hydrogenase component 2
MQGIKIDNALCDRAPGCPSARVCPTGAIVPAPGGAYPGANGYTVVDELCRGCLVCARVCAGGAVQPG